MLQQEQRKQTETEEFNQLEMDSQYKNGYFSRDISTLGLTLSTFLFLFTDHKHTTGGGSSGSWSNAAAAGAHVHTCRISGLPEVRLESSCACVPYAWSIRRTCIESRRERRVLGTVDALAALARTL